MIDAQDFVLKCSTAASHIELYEYICKELCNSVNNMFPIVKFIISDPSCLNDQTKFQILCSCFDEIESRKLIIQAMTDSNSEFSLKLIEMLLCDLIPAKGEKEEFLKVFEVVSHPNKLKLIKRLFKNSSRQAIADQIISGNPFNFSLMELSKVAEFASEPVFIKLFAELDQKSLNFSSLIAKCPEKFLKFLEFQFENLKWHQYLAHWAFINDKIKKVSHCHYIRHNIILIGLIGLYQRFPPFICDKTKAISDSTPDYSSNLNIESWSSLFPNSLLFKSKPDGVSVVEVFNLLTSSKVSLYKFFIEQYGDMLIYWDLKDSEKDFLMKFLIDSIENSTNLHLKVDFDAFNDGNDIIMTDNSKILSACCAEIFKNVLISSTKLRIKTFESILNKFDLLMMDKFQKLTELSNLSSSLSLAEEIFQDPLEIVYLRNVINKNLALITESISKYLDRLWPKFIKSSTGLIKVIRKCVELLNKFFELLFNASQGRNAEITLLYQDPLKSLSESIFTLRTKLATKIGHNLPIQACRYSKPIAFKVNPEMTAFIEEFLIKSDTFNNWISSWIGTFYSYLENCISLNDTPSRIETKTFSTFHSFFSKTVPSLLEQTVAFDRILLLPAIELLRKLDSFEFNYSKNQRFCVPGTTHISCIKNILSFAIPLYAYNEKNLDEIFKSHLIYSSILANNNPSRSDGPLSYSFDELITSITFIADSCVSNPPKLDSSSKYFSQELFEIIAKHFKFLLNIKSIFIDKNNGKILDLKSLLYSKNMIGFFNQLCRNIYHQVDEKTKDSIENSSDVNCFFENCFLFNLPADSKLVQNYFNKKILKAEAFEDKMPLYSRLFNSAVEQMNLKESSTVDLLLIVSDFVQPKIARVNWQSKMMEHPFLAKMCLIYIPEFQKEKNQDFLSLEHSNKVMSDI